MTDEPTVTCPTCKGSGNATPGNPCPTCRGSGQLSQVDYNDLFCAGCGQQLNFLGFCENEECPNFVDADGAF